MENYTLHHLKEAFAWLNRNGGGPGLLPPRAAWGVLDSGYVNVSFLARAS